jgi:hypothetical protein
MAETGSHKSYLVPIRIFTKVTKHPVKSFHTSGEIKLTWLASIAMRSEPAQEQLPAAASSPYQTRPA